MEWHTLHQLMKDHPKEVVLDEEYINDIIVPSMEKYLKESKKLVEAIIGIYREQIKRIDEDRGPRNLCGRSQKCTHFMKDCKRCYEDVVEKLEKVLEDMN